LFAVLQDVTDLFAHFCTTGFPGDQYMVTLLAQAGYQTIDVRGLSASFAAFKSDECALFGHFLKKFLAMIVPGCGGQDLAPSLLFLRRNCARMAGEITQEGFQNATNSRTTSGSRKRQKRGQDAAQPVAAEDGSHPRWPSMTTRSSAT
jgi:hypothetical protein